MNNSLKRKCLNKTKKIWFRYTFKYISGYQNKKVESGFQSIGGAEAGYSAQGSLSGNHRP